MSNGSPTLAGFQAVYELLPCQIMRDRSYSLAILMGLLILVALVAG